MRGGETSHPNCVALWSAQRSINEVEALKFHKLKFTTGKFDFWYKSRAQAPKMFVFIGFSSEKMNLQVRLWSGTYTPLGSEAEPTMSVFLLLVKKLRINVRLLILSTSADSRTDVDD